MYVIVYTYPARPDRKMFAHRIVFDTLEEADAVARELSERQHVVARIMQFNDPRIVNDR